MLTCNANKAARGGKGGVKGGRVSRSKSLPKPPSGTETLGNVKRSYAKAVPHDIHGYNAPTFVPPQHAPIVAKHGHALSTSRSTRFSVRLAPTDKEPDDPLPLETAIEFLPESFDGENMPVNRFITNCLLARDSIAFKYRRYLFLIVRSRIVGNAYDFLQNLHVNSLEELLSHLKEIYSEQHSMSQLNKALAVVVQYEKEKVIQYAARVSKILTNMIDLIEYKYDLADCHFHIEAARELARDCFVSGLRGNLRRCVKIEKPSTLQEAINLAKKYEYDFV